MAHLGYARAMSAYDGQSDDELMTLARRALAAAAAEKPGTIERAMKFAAHDSVMNELKRRLVRKLNAELGLPDIDL